MLLVSVAVPVPHLGPLTYRIPEGATMPCPGARVRVPLGARQVVGVVLGPGQPGDDATATKPVLDTIDSEPLVPLEVLDLCAWVADYYVAGIGDTLALATPPGAADRASSFRVERAARVTEAGCQALSTGRLGSRPLTTKQRETLSVLSTAPAGASATAWRTLGLDAGVLSRLASAGGVEITRQRAERDPFARAALVPSADAATSRTLSDDQARAVGDLSARVERGAFHVTLLHGVTGSGKTEVYVRLAVQTVAAGRTALVLVPEIALTPALAGVFGATFGARVAIQHSGLSAGERHDQWHRIRQGEVDVVVGTRSAVFSPLARLGLVVIDEEHDASYKQDETPRYHGRDVAIVRASRVGALVVLGSATPSLESYAHAESGKYSKCVLGTRVMDRAPAAVRVVNMRDVYAAKGPDVIVGPELETAIAHRLEVGEQAMVLLNRRGFATAVFCRQCGDTFECPNCSVSLTVHGATRGWRARCHYCNFVQSVPPTCRKCAAPYLEHAGFGTERVEAVLRERFPEARIARVDRDTIRRQGALTELLRRFAGGKIDILVGTQMIAKGHDFPRVTLVGVISADVGLGVADFRAGERTFQLLTQVVGRAGRGDRPGEAIVQTLYPEHYSIEFARRQDYAGFFAREYAYRQAMHYPPAVALINAIVKGRSFEAAMEDARRVVALVQARAAGRFEVLGPAPAALGRVRGSHRVQFFLKGTNRALLRLAIRAALEECGELRRRVSVDVDPLNVL